MKESETAPTPTVWSRTETPSNTAITYAEDLAQPHKLPDGCFSLCEPLRALVSWLCGPGSRGVLDPLAPTIFPLPLKDLLTEDFS